MTLRGLQTAGPFFLSPAPRHTLATAATDVQTKTPDATAESAEYHPTSLHHGPLQAAEHELPPRRLLFLS